MYNGMTYREVSVLFGEPGKTPFSFPFIEPNWHEQLIHDVYLFADGCVKACFNRRTKRLTTKGMLCKPSEMRGSFSEESEKTFPRKKLYSEEDYHSVQNGMYYDEVVRLLGSPDKDCKYMSESHGGNYDSHYISTWTSELLKSRKIIVYFENYKVVGKSCLGF
jgi:outer membrane protein assembly factor BamE (lipoprotein component of BamABCDE complex)